MSEPRTAAGRAEHQREHRHCRTLCANNDRYSEGECPVVTRILAIEAEAAEDALDARDMAVEQKQLEGTDWRKESTPL